MKKEIIKNQNVYYKNKINWYTASTSITLSFGGFGSIVIPLSIGIACGLTINSKEIYEIAMQQYNDQKTIWKRPTKKYIFW